MKSSPGSLFVYLCCSEHICTLSALSTFWQALSTSLLKTLLQIHLLQEDFSSKTTLPSPLHHSISPQHDCIWFEIYSFVLALTWSCEVTLKPSWYSMTKRLSSVWFQANCLTLMPQISPSITWEDHNLSSNGSDKNKWECKYKLTKGNSLKSKLFLG